MSNTIDEARKVSVAKPLDKKALTKFKTYLEYELNRKCYTPEYYEVLKHFLTEADLELSMKGLK